MRAISLRGRRGERRRGLIAWVSRSGPRATRGTGMGMEGAAWTLAGSGSGRGCFRGFRVARSPAPCCEPVGVKRLGMRSLQGVKRWAGSPSRLLSRLVSGLVNGTLGPLRAEGGRRPGRGGRSQARRAGPALPPAHSRPSGCRGVNVIQCGPCRWRRGIDGRGRSRTAGRAGGCRGGTGV